MFTEEERDQAQIDEEVDNTMKMIELVPQNESPYNYLRGLKNHYKIDFAKLKIKDRLIEIADDNNYHAHSLLADIYEEEVDDTKFNETIETLLKIDSIRRKYWGWRRENFKK